MGQRGPLSPRESSPGRDDVRLHVIDTVQHYFWQHMDRDHFIHDPKLAPKFGDAVRKVYERLDAATGQIIDRLPEETTVFVVSDHGGGRTVDRTIFLNVISPSSVSSITTRKRLQVFTVSARN